MHEKYAYHNHGAADPQRAQGTAIGCQIPMVLPYVPPIAALRSYTDNLTANFCPADSLYVLCTLPPIA
jgi:hypothetical protein